MNLSQSYISEIHVIDGLMIIEVPVHCNTGLSESKAEFWINTNYRRVFS